MLKTKGRFTCNFFVQTLILLENFTLKMKLLPLKSVNLLQLQRAKQIWKNIKAGHYEKNFTFYCQYILGFQS